MNWGKIPRVGTRRKKAYDEWAEYYQSVNGNRPVATSYKRGARRSGYFRITAVLVILAVLMVARQYPHPVGDQVRENLRQMLTAEWDFRPFMDKTVKLAAQLVNWDDPVIHGGPEEEPVTEPVSGTGLDAGDLSIPVSGKVVAQFGWVKSPVDDMERYHSGIDIAAAQGENVGAAMDGRVEKIDESQELGKYILIRHDEGTYTLYGGLGEIAVEEGQLIRAGEKIAAVGSEGDVHGGGLHFELREKGKLVDPLTRLQMDTN